MADQALQVLDPLLILVDGGLLIEDLRTLLNKLLFPAEKVIKEKILPTRKDIVSVYSDGSLSRGDMIPGSDIDIAVVVDNPSLEQKKR